MKPLDFAQYKKLRSMTLNEINRWFNSIYKSGVLDGHGVFGKDRHAWRLQGGGNLFETEDAAVRYLHGETGDVSDV